MENKLWFAAWIFIIFGFLLSCVTHAQNEDGFRKANNKIYVIAHRGVHTGIPENSLPAYQKAIELGCDFVEIDIRTTKDGRFVSIHNSTIDSYVIGKTGTVRDMTLAELKDLDIGEKLGEEWKSTRIPAFEEILQLCKGKIGIYLDLKDAPVPELMKIIRKFDMENDVVWYFPFQKFLELENTEELFGNSWPMPDPQTVLNLHTLFKNSKFKLIAADMGMLTKSFVNEAHKKGAMVFADDKKATKKEWQKMIDCGVNGIQTDRPAELIELLTKN